MSRHPKQQACTKAPRYTFWYGEIHLFGQVSHFIVTGSNGSLNSRMSLDTPKIPFTPLFLFSKSDTPALSQVLFFHDESHSTGINVTTTGTHHQAFQRSQSHTGIYALTILTAVIRTTVTNVASDNLLSLGLLPDTHTRVVKHNGEKP